MTTALSTYAALAMLVAAGVAAAFASMSVSRRPASRPALPARTTPPALLRDTGLFADATQTRIAPGILPFTPQYPLWTDGATKRRWIYLPPGTAIDASDADAWVFPIGTRVWKEFSFGGARVETRYMEHTAQGWRYATFVWDREGTEARVARAPPSARRSTGPVSSWPRWRASRRGTPSGASSSLA